MLISLRQLLLGLNSVRSPCTAKLEDCVCTTEPPDFWKQCYLRVSSLKWSQRKWEPALESSKGNACFYYGGGCSAEWVQKGLCSLSRNCEWCTRVFWGRIINLQAKSEIAAPMLGQDSTSFPAGMRRLFPWKLSCFRSGWAEPASQRSFGICAGCEWLG